MENFRNKIIGENIELYDLKNDPNSIKNVADNYPLQVLTMKKELFDWIVEKEEYYLIENHPAENF
jgi:hypothetical protein